LLHCRLSTNFFTYQLSDMFAYELSMRRAVGSLVSDPFDATPRSPFILVYNLHNLLFNNRVFIFVKILSQSGHYSNISTITELFANSNWLEREIAELNGVQFFFKKDLRNLMLQYGDVSTPFRKAFPSIGFRETVYDLINDSVVQSRIDLQN
jgi:NADH:ubiquinone oxidoreductase subunit C